MGTFDRHGVMLKVTSCYDEQHSVCEIMSTVLLRLWDRKNGNQRKKKQELLLKEESLLLASSTAWSSFHSGHSVCSHHELQTHVSR